MKLTLSISIENASKDDLAAMTAALKAGGWHRLAAALESSKKVNELEGVSGPPGEGEGRPGQLQEGPDHIPGCEEGTMKVRRCQFSAGCNNAVAFSVRKVTRIFQVGPSGDLAEAKALTKELNAGNPAAGLDALDLCAKHYKGWGYPMPKAERRRS